MEVDQPVISESADNDNGLRQKMAIAEKALLECNDSRTFSRRARKDALRVLCQDRHLDDRGDKIELASRLITWVDTAFTSKEPWLTHL